MNVRAPKRLDDCAPALSVTRTLRLKVKSESYAFLNAAAFEVNNVWSWANSISEKAARPCAGTPKWLSGFDLCSVSSGASEHFQRAPRRQPTACKTVAVCGMW